MSPPEIAGFRAKSEADFPFIQQMSPIVNSQVAKSEAIFRYPGANVANCEWRSQERSDFPLSGRNVANCEQPSRHEPADSSAGRKCRQLRTAVRESVVRNLAELSLFGDISVAPG
ncbi:hypothetical protein AVEN_29830-1 [Araneus ventricosus]|uniref:Uncharacterized protein n=1 Tax=Araneus ventricosus TaxID=182803 RepID=A0A4Y2J9S0_ARAVE|nr:hypothetical protein AVEN_29830-1 [Araneus ventricosus]